jgi:hypothetical protein
MEVELSLEMQNNKRKKYQENYLAVTHGIFKSERGIKKTLMVFIAPTQ